MISFSESQNLPPKRNAQKKHEAKENNELLQGLIRAKAELDIAAQNFTFATDPLLVDVYSYQIKAAQAKYSYLLQIARIKGLTHYDYIKRVAQG